MPFNNVIRVLVVDDEEEMRDLLSDYLSRHGCVVRAVASGASLDIELVMNPVDVILLDLSLPGEDGLTITRRIRKTSTTPIIIVTGADEIVDRVVGLEVGADDYVTKPFDLRELKARIRSVIRRSIATHASDNISDQSPISRHVNFGKLRLDLDAGRLLNSDGETESMTPMEYQLLSVFAERPHKVLSRDMLLELTDGPEAISTARSIDIRITRLRARVELDPSQPRVIRTIRGAGYMFVPSD
ncbi:response regulator transcription factor [Rhizobium sp. FKL33]|uniref:response regulator n=1 Tax=Rhizobium sp. FKL33 TaxID=2562307 RepID=UPI0010C0A598|nr:response regulator transcription factor [Rhizobium sp. FKL33]